MIKFNFQEYCSGCGACRNICPTGAIQMESRQDGFYYPIIDDHTCVGCNLCERVCPHLHAQEHRIQDSAIPHTWLYASKDNDAKKRSASGGAFYELAKGHIQHGGAVCGCAWDDDLSAKHIIGRELKDIQRMQGSKYVQSDVNMCYKQSLELLKQGVPVLFSGTPCQCVAMHNMVTTSNEANLRDKLTTVAVICHGISAPSVWESCKRWMEKQQGSRLVEVNFRDKSKEGYKKSYCRYEFANGTVVYLPTFLPSSKFIEATLVYNLGIRKSCSHCDCKGLTQACDLIIGDWYAEYQGEGEMGTSCVVACTENGRLRVQQTLVHSRQFEYEQVLNHNAFIENSVKLTQKRDEFMELYTTNDDIWDEVERFYPSKYPLKKFLIQCGLYHIVKRWIG